MFWRKREKEIVSDFNSIYCFSVSPDEKSVITQSPSQKTEFTDKSILLYGRKKWWIFKVPFNIRMDEHIAFRLRFSEKGLFRFALVIWDSDGCELWTDFVEKRKGKTTYFFTERNLKIPSFSGKEKVFNHNIRHIGVYIYSLKEKCEIDYPVIETGSVKPFTLKEMVFDKFAGLLRNSTVLSGDRILNSVSDNNSLYIKTNSDCAEREVELHFPVFVNSEFFRGFNLYGEFPRGTIAGIITEHGIKLENSLCSEEKLTVIFENINNYKKDTRVKGIFFRFISNPEFSVKNIFFLMEKDSVSRFLSEKNERNRFLKGGTPLFSEGQGFWKDESGISIRENGELSINIEPFRAKERNFFNLSWNLYSNSYILKDDIEGFVLGFSSSGTFSLRLILTDDKDNEYWTLPFRINSDTSGIINYDWVDFFQPDWIEKKNEGTSIIGISLLFETDENINFRIYSNFIRKKNSAASMNNQFGKCMYPVYEMFIHDHDSVRDIDIKTSPGTQCFFDSENGNILEYIPDSSSKDQYASIWFGKTGSEFISIADTSGIVLNLEGERSENTHRIILRDEMGNELWSNPIEIHHGKRHYFFDMSGFGSAQQGSGKKIGKYITETGFNITGIYDEKIFIKDMQIFTYDPDYYFQLSKDRNISELYPDGTYQNCMDIIVSDNIRIDKRKDNLCNLSFRNESDSFVIFRYNTAKSGYTDFSGFNKISLNIQADFNAEMKILLRDLSGKEIFSDIVNIHEGRNIYHEFRKEDFEKWETEDFSASMLKYFEVHLNNIQTETQKISIFHSRPCISGRKITRNHYYYSSDFNFFTSKELSDFWTNSGEHAGLRLYNAWNDKSLDYPCLRGEFEIKSEDSEKNWIILRKELKNTPLDLSDYEFFCFYFRIDTRGIALRITFSDSKGREVSFRFTDISDFQDFIKVTLNVSYMADSIDITDIISYEFYIGLDWAKPVISGNFYFADFSEKKKIPENNLMAANRSISKSLEIEEFEKRIQASEMKVRIGNELYSFDEIKKLAQKKLDSGSRDFSSGDIAMEESRKNRKWGLSQAAVFIEPTNLCNLACIMCNHGDNSFERPLGVMKFKDFRRLIDEVGTRKFNIWELSPFWMGEPFIHPQINDFIDYISNIRRIPGTIQHFNIHTNGNVLSDEHIECIIKSELDSILFSIDAANEDTYRKIRVNGELSIVTENIEKLLKARNSAGRKRPAVIMQFILMDENIGEIKDFVDMGKKLGIERVIYAGRKEDNILGLPQDPNLLFPQIDYDLIFIKALEPNALTKDQTHREIITTVPEGMKRRPCGSLWRMFSVAWDGQATACCRDDQVKMPVGNVLEHGLENVWYGEKLKELRLAHIKGEFEKAPKCVDCVNWVKYPMTNSEITEWLESVGEYELASEYAGKDNKDA